MSSPRREKSPILKNFLELNNRNVINDFVDIFCKNCKKTKKQIPNTIDYIEWVLYDCCDNPNWTKGQHKRTKKKQELVNYYNLGRKDLQEIADFRECKYDTEYDKYDMIDYLMTDCTISKSPRRRKSPLKQNLVEVDNKNHNQIVETSRKAYRSLSLGSSPNKLYCFPRRIDITKYYLSKDDIYNEINRLLEHYKNIWWYQIDMEMFYNISVPIAFTDIGRFGELLAALLTNGVGGGSKGGCAFDIIIPHTGENVEVKTICLIQPKICVSNNCRNNRVKVPYFQEICIYCNESKFKLQSDSRAGIDVKAHFKEGIHFYIIIVITYNESINIDVYKIHSNNKYFTEYLTNQYENSTSNTANLLPYSYDFYASGPIKIMNYEITRDNVNGYLELDNKTSEKIPINIFNKQELSKYDIFVGNTEYNDYIDYEDIRNKLKLRKKNLNKKRGKIKRKQHLKKT